MTNYAAPPPSSQSAATPSAFSLPEKSKALGLYESMVLIRQYEERIYFLFLEGRISGSIHQSHGQEACAAGMLYDTRPTDYMASTHRPASHDLAKGVSLDSMMCEMYAKSNGCCHGKGGAMHTGDISVGAIPANAIVGSNIPISTGIAFSCKMRKTDNVVICFFGDGASNEGAFHEGINGAAVWNLPVVFVCENNQYGASTSVKATMKIETIAERAASYGIPGERIDGNDVLAVNDAATRAIQRARRGEGPTLLELMTYRIAGHSRSDACAIARTRRKRTGSRAIPSNCSATCCLRPKLRPRPSWMRSMPASKTRRPVSRASRILPRSTSRRRYERCLLEFRPRETGAKRNRRARTTRAAPAGN